MNEDEKESLSALIEKRSWRQVSTFTEKFVRRKIDGAHFALFQPLLVVKEYSIYKDVMLIVAKMKNPPAEAFDAVLSAWQSTWLGGCPQCGDVALRALLAINSEDPRILTEIEKCLSVDNYQVQKECALALMKIDSVAAREILGDFESYLPRKYTEKLVVNLLEKIERFLAG